MNSAPSFSPFPLADFQRHESRIRGAIDRVLTGSTYILGDEVAAFEADFADWVGTRHCVGVANGTDALELLLRAWRVGPGHRVAVPSHTAVASVSAIERAGATPLFVDVDRRTRTLSPATLREALNRPEGADVRAVIAVHLYGHPAPIEPIAEICRESGAILLEDCAQAHGAEFKGRRVGGLAQGAAFSFYPTKNLGAMGDGGAVCTNDQDLAERLRRIRQYGWADDRVSHFPGVNSRLDELQAAILRAKLPALDEALQKRHQLASLYERRLIGLDWLELPATAPDSRHAWHLYVIQTEHREALKRHLEDAGIPVGIHYPAAVHQQPAYRHLSPGPDRLPHTDALIPRILTLPLHPHLSEEAIEFACAAVQSFPA